MADPIEQKRQPRSVVDAQFSAPYAAAIALIYGDAGIDQYTDDILADPRLEPLMARTECFSSPDLDAVYPRRWPASVEIELMDGRVLRNRTEYALGEPENWVSKKMLVDKFDGLAGWHEGSHRLAERLLSGGATETVMALTGLIAARSSQTQDVV